MKSKQYHFIINPSASSGNGLRLWSRVEAVLKREEILYQAHILHNADEVEKLVRRLTGQEETAGMRRDSETAGLRREGETATTGGGRDCHLVVLGGDGTLNAVLNGIISFEHTVLSCIRTGSGNDFARNMGVCKNAEKALYGILRHDDEELLDYGVVAEDGRRFLISSGTGYDADICEEVSRSRLKGLLNKIHLGKLVYVTVGVKQIFTRKSVNAVIRMDDEEQIRVSNLFFVVGMIQEKEGGGVPFCPGADAGDGLLDICLVRDMPKWKLLLAVMLVYAKKHFLFRNITAHRCRRIAVKTEEPQWFHLDGETPGRIQEITLECRTGLRFLK